MEEAETALAAEVPTPAEQDGATPDARASGVRSVVLRNGMKASSQDEAMHAEMLATFRTTADPAIAIRLWYGDRADDLARDPARLKVALARDIAELDDAMTEMLNAVLHHDRFQRLEAIWRGAALVVDAAEDSENVRIRILNARWAEMARDLERAVEFDQSSLFQKVYGDEFDMPGGTPYGMLVVDHEVQHRPRPGRAADDLSTLAGLAQIGQSAFSPVIIGCSPALFGLETFREFGLPIDLKAVLKQAEYQRFNRFRDSEEARFVGLVVPRVLLRLPYTQAPETNVGFPYREDRFGM